MKRIPLGLGRPLPFLAAALLGAASATSGDSSPAARVPFLFDLHLHGSLSEGAATMAHHSAEAERLGYDGLWWSDHMSRQMAHTYWNQVGFEGSLQQLNGNWFQNEFRLEEELPGACQLSYAAEEPAEGSLHLRARHEVPSGAGWTESRLSFHNTQDFHHRSLICQPEVRLALRLQQADGNASFLIRVSLSSRADGATPEGTVNVLEYHPARMNPPAPAANVARVPLAGFQTGVWNPVALPVAADAAAAFWEGEDQTLTGVELVFLSNHGKAIEMDVDDFRIELAGPTGLPVYRAQEQLLAARHSASLIHHVGMEIEGPVQQPILSISTRDHLLALYPAGIPALIDYRDPASRPDDYPASGVDDIHAQGGVAVLAHLFGALTHGAPKPESAARELARRLLQHQAWGADALEVGYPFRERPLADFLAVWDQLAERGLYLTGIGSSDDHDVLPWDQRGNRWASWLRSTGGSATELIQAVREGQVLFGDPTAFDPAGDLVFEQAGGAYSMGDVVPTGAGTEQLRLRVDGGQAGDDLVLLRNGDEAQRLSLAGAVLDQQVDQAVAPGDWLRLELRDASDQPYLLSNPIYFVEIGVTPPPHRTPGP